MTLKWIQDGARSRRDTGVEVRWTHTQGKVRKQDADEFLPESKEVPHVSGHRRGKQAAP